MLRNVLLFRMVNWNSSKGSPETFTQIPWNRSGTLASRNSRSWQAGAPLEGLMRHQSEQGSQACHDVLINRSTCTEDDSHAIITSPKAKRTKPAILFSIVWLWMMQLCKTSSIDDVLLLFFHGCAVQDLLFSIVLKIFEWNHFLFESTRSPESRAVLQLKIPKLLFFVLFSVSKSIRKTVK